MKPRAALVFVHRWFGLLAALWLLLVGLSGSVLVFYAEIDRALNPSLLQAAPGPLRASPDEAVAAVEASRRGRQVTSFWMQADPAEAWTFNVTDAGSAANTDVLFDPVAERVMGERVWDELAFDRAHAMPLLYTFHYNLLLGPWGDWAIGLLGFLWVLDHVVSAILSFPVVRRWRESFRIRRRGYRRTFDLHRALGLWFFPVTLIVAATGMWMNWRPYAEAAIAPVSERTAFPGEDAPILPQPLVDPPVTFGQAIKRTGMARPQGASYDPARGIYLVAGFDARDLSSDYGQLYHVVDARSGMILSREHLTEGSAADVIDAWLLPLHSGKVAGWPGRILVLISGLVLCSFIVTGIAIWRRKRMALRHANRPYSDVAAAA